MFLAPNFFLGGKAPKILRTIVKDYRASKSFARSIIFVNSDAVALRYVIATYLLSRCYWQPNNSVEIRTIISNTANMAGNMYASAGTSKTDTFFQTTEREECSRRAPKPVINIEHTLAIVKPDAMHKAEEIEDILLKSGFTIINVRYNIDVWLSLICRKLAGELQVI